MMTHEDYVSIACINLKTRAREDFMFPSCLDERNDLEEWAIYAGENAYVLDSIVFLNNQHYKARRFYDAVGNMLNKVYISGLDFGKFARALYFFLEEANEEQRYAIYYGCDKYWTSSFESIVESVEYGEFEICYVVTDHNYNYLEEIGEKYAREEGWLDADGNVVSKTFVEEAQEFVVLDYERIGEMVTKSEKSKFLSLSEGDAYFFCGRWN